MLSDGLLKAAVDAAVFRIVKAIKGGRYSVDWNLMLPSVGGRWREIREEGGSAI